MSYQGQGEERASVLATCLPINPGSFTNKRVILPCHVKGVNGSEEESLSSGSNIPCSLELSSMAGINQPSYGMPRKQFGVSTKRLCPSAKALSLSTAWVLLPQVALAIALWSSLESFCPVLAHCYSDFQNNEHTASSPIEKEHMQQPPLTSL